MLTCEYDHEGHRICGSSQPLSPVQVHHIARVQLKPAWLRPGKFHAIVQTTYNQLLLYPSVRREFLRVLDYLQLNVICIRTSGCYWLFDDIGK